MSHQSPDRPGKMFQSNWRQLGSNKFFKLNKMFESYWRQLGTSRVEDKSDLKEIPVDVLAGGGELLLLGSGQQLVDVLHTSSLLKLQIVFAILDRVLA